MPCPAAETKVADIEAKFTGLTERDDIGIILINQHVRGCGGSSCGLCLTRAPHAPCR